jgi:hypothetical protein
VQDPGTKKTKILMKQIPNSLMIFCPDLMFLEDKRSWNIDSYLKKFHSDNPYEVVQEFIRALDTIRNSCIFRFQSHPRVPKLTEEEQEKFRGAKVCEKCKKPFHTKDRPKVRHHCHITGQYIGAWCRKCNFLEGKNNFKLVIFFHNLRSYDSHIIIRYGLTEIAKLHGKQGTIEQFIIGKSSEKLSSFQFGHFIFRDSLLHLGCSLERAVNNLIKIKYDFPISEKLGLHPILRKKGSTRINGLIRYRNLNVPNFQGLTRVGGPGRFRVSRCGTERARGDGGGEGGGAGRGETARG